MKKVAAMFLVIVAVMVGAETNELLGYASHLFPFLGGFFAYHIWTE